MANKPLVLVSQTTPESDTGVVSFPNYDRTYVPKVLHLGAGGFFRAHWARILDEYNNAHPQDPWNVHGVITYVGDNDLQEYMRAQANLYTLVERSGTQDSARIIGSVTRMTTSSSNILDVRDAIADPRTKIVTLTVTEKGYHYDAEGNLDFNDPQVAEDIKQGSITPIAMIYRGLKERYYNDGGPMTVLSLDNLPGNGDMTRDLLMQFAEAVGETRELRRWIVENVSFPNSMVDRITPAPTQATNQFVADKCGIEDRAAVICESHLQLVVEDNFAAGRPALEEIGVTFVGDVKPYELMKVRMLNGSHSALAYISYLLGHRKVDVAMADPDVAAFVKGYMEKEVIPAVLPPEGVDLFEYGEQLRARFSNPDISDDIQRLAQDGTSKIPNAIVPVIAHNVETGRVSHAAFAVAAWYLYLGAKDEHDATIDVTDPRAGEMKTIFGSSPEGDPRRFIQETGLFAPEVHNSELFIREVTNALDDIRRFGMRKALQALLISQQTRKEASGVERPFAPETP